MDSYKSFLLDTAYPYCWYCGRTPTDYPDQWHAPWLIDRAHIVNKPRIEDRRVVVLLCSRCHRASHGDRIAGFALPAPTLGHMLFLKRVFDREYFDLEFLRQYSVGSLPAALVPSPEVMHEYAMRHGRYPAVQRTQG